MLKVSLVILFAFIAQGLATPTSLLVKKAPQFGCQHTTLFLLKPMNSRKLSTGTSDAVIMACLPLILETNEWAYRIVNAVLNVR